MTSAQRQGRRLLPRARQLALAALVAVVPMARAAPLDDALATMRAARASEGFELRLAVSTPTGRGDAEDVVRLAVIGQSGPQTQHVLVKVTAPASLRDARVVAEQAEGRVRAWLQGPDGAASARPAEPMAPLFGTQLVAWDLLTPWWDWTHQHLGEDAIVQGHRCQWIRSRPPAGGDAEVGEVQSCVDLHEGLAWRVDIFDPHHRRLRTIEVTQAVRTQAGVSTARRATVTGADGGRSRVEVYSGDEHHAVPPGTFALPAASFTHPE